MVSKIYRVSVYVGPVHVEHYAAQARQAGYTNVFAGTEAVHADVVHPVLVDDTDRLCFRQRVTDTVYGSPMAAGWRDTTILGTK